MRLKEQNPWRQWAGRIVGGQTTGPVIASHSLTLFWPPARWPRLIGLLLRRLSNKVKDSEQLKL